MLTHPERPTNGWRLADSLSATRVETMPRQFSGQSITLTSGGIFLAHFTPDSTIPVGTLGTIQIGTSAGTVTLCKMGLYSIAANGDATCIARTANNTGLWQNTAVAHTGVIANDGQGNNISSVTLTRRRRYAFAALFVGTTAPVLSGKAFGSSVISAFAPQLCTLMSAQTDLIGSIPIGSQAATASLLYGYGTA
jgi:hypothetical protein